MKRLVATISVLFVQTKMFVIGANLAFTFPRKGAAPLAPVCGRR